MKISDTAKVDIYDCAQELRQDIEATIDAARKLGVTSAECRNRDSVFRGCIRDCINKQPLRFMSQMNIIAQAMVAEYDSELQVTIIQKA